MSKDGMTSIPRAFAALSDFDIVGGGEIAVDRRVAVRSGAELGQQAARLGWVVAAIAADLGQLGQAGNLQPPAFVVAEVQVQLVELVPAHLLDDLEHLGLAVEVARKVDVQPAKVEARRILDLERAQQAVLVRRFLRERLQARSGRRRHRTRRCRCAPLRAESR